MPDPAGRRDAMLVQVNAHRSLIFAQVLLQQVFPHRLAEGRLDPDATAATGAGRSGRSGPLHGSRIDDFSRQPRRVKRFRVRIAVRGYIRRENAFEDAALELTSRTR